MKTKVIISTVLVGISALAFAAKKTNDISAVSFNPGKFYGLIVNSNANIILTQGEHNSVKIEGDKNEVKEIKTEVQNGALVISGKMSHALTIYITAEEINLIEINGSARVFTSGQINSDIILLKVNGDGSLKADVRVLTVGMIIKGNGKIIVSGRTGDSYVRLFGNGTVNTEKLDSFRKTDERIAYYNNAGNKIMSDIHHQ